MLRRQGWLQEMTRLEGSVTLRPLRRLLGGVAAFLIALPGPASTLTVTVQNRDGKPIPGAIITAQPGVGSAPAAPVRAAMSQVNLSFSPDLLVIPVGSSVDFPNNDTVSHQIYSFSDAKRFQLPLYRGKPYPPVLFDKAGVVSLGCNIHDAMLAYIVVTDAPYFGRSDAAGVWNAEVSAGKYRIVVWHPLLRDLPADLEREVVVDEGGHAELTLKLKKSLRPAPIQDRPHSWDAY